MKLKRIAAMLLCLTAIFSFSACKYRLKTSNYEEQQIDGVTLECKNATSTTGSFVLKNETDKNVDYENFYRLECYKNGKWKSMVMQYANAVVSESIYISPNSADSITHEWNNRYGELKNGKYRYVLFCQIEGEPGVYISCEFEIE